VKNITNLGCYLRGALFWVFFDCYISYGNLVYLKKYKKFKIDIEVNMERIV